MLGCHERLLCSVINACFLAVMLILWSRSSFVAIAFLPIMMFFLVLVVLFCSLWWYFCLELFICVVFQLIRLVVLSAGISRHSACLISVFVLAQLVLTAVLYLFVFYVLYYIKYTIFISLQFRYELGYIWHQGPHDSRLNVDFRYVYHQELGAFR